MVDVRKPGDAAKPPPRLPRWLWAIFIGSVALNLLIAGSFAGMHMAGHDHGGRGLRGLLSSLPGDKRKEIRGILTRHRGEVRPLRRELRQRRRELVEYLRQDTIDRGELERRLIALERRQQEIRMKLRPMVMELSEKLSPEERAQVLRRFLGGRRDHHRGRRRWWHRSE